MSGLIRPSARRAAVAAAMQMTANVRAAAERGRSPWRHIERHCSPMLLALMTRCRSLRGTDRAIQTAGRTFGNGILDAPASQNMEERRLPRFVPSLVDTALTVGASASSGHCA